MADEDNAPQPQQQAQESAQPPAEPAPELPPPQNAVPPSPPPPAPQEDRSELLHRARAFLSSPQVRHEDLIAKRRFLAEKGLTDGEIEGLLHDVPPPPPPLPPRTYPQPPPSRLPYLLLNVIRAFSWIAGGSAALLLMYFRFIYPKIAQTYQARLSLRTHRKLLLERLTHSLEDLKAKQRATFAVLPQPEPFREPERYRSCRTLDELAAASEGKTDVPPITLLRCAIQDLAKGAQKASTAELLRALEDKFPWIAEDGAQREEALWRTLTTTPVFQPAPPPPGTTATPPTLDTEWTYVPPPPPPAPPLLSSLSSLATALPSPPQAQSHQSPQPKYQHTLQALSDLTGYIAAQTYAAPLGLRAPGFGLGTGAPLPPAEEEVRREIRALKGLVLNRRSFMPRVPSAASLAAAAAARSSGVEPPAAAGAA
ncbi:hypothetical protein BD413DRAFT_475017 [Trametes elegans]|nr:hypothetical protein BD413DRAFT_475017 [Trametes elegans]